MVKHSKTQRGSTEDAHELIASALSASAAGAEDAMMTGLHLEDALPGDQKWALVGPQEMVMVSWEMET